ncbi:MAG: hypothetical protein IAE67_02225 [Candidatus Competibacteraceae bacterium]|nr:hypothetical protein [Candidatus Competibacteraceae bacterium]
MLRVQQLLQKSSLNVGDMEKLHDELRQAYEWSTLLKHGFHSSTVHSSAQTTVPASPATSKVPHASSPVQAAVFVPTEVSQPQIPMQEPKPAVTSSSPKQSPMTVQEARVTLNDINSMTAHEPLADKLSQTRVVDLSKSIAIHEKFHFINELFQGDNIPYNRFIEEANQSESLDQANRLIAQYRIQYKWEEENKAYQKLINFVQRKHI